MVTSVFGNIVGQSLLVNLNGSGTSPPRTEISATGNITGGMLKTTGNVSAVGNIITAGNAIISATVRAGNLLSNGIISATGAITGASLALNSGTLSAGNIISVGPLTAQTTSITGNITGGNISTVGKITATGNIQGSYFIGNGSQLTGVSGSAAAGSLTGTGLSTNVIYSSLTSVGTLGLLNVAGTLTVSSGKNVLVSNVQRTITVSISAPSGGNVGDIWYQTV